MVNANLAYCLNIVLNVKVLVGALNKEKDLQGVAKRLANFVSLSVTHF